MSQHRSVHLLKCFVITLSISVSHASAAPLTTGIITADFRATSSLASVEERVSKAQHSSAQDIAALKTEIAKLKVEWEEKHAAYQKIMANSGGNLSKTGRARVAKLDSEARLIKARIDALEAQLEAALDASRPQESSNDEMGIDEEDREPRLPSMAEDAPDAPLGGSGGDAARPSEPETEDGRAHPKSRLENLWIPPFRIHDPDTDLSDLAEEITIRVIDRTTAYERTTQQYRWLLPPIGPESTRWFQGPHVFVGKADAKGNWAFIRPQTNETECTLLSRRVGLDRIAYEWLERGNLKSSGLIEGWEDKSRPTYKRARVKRGVEPLLMNLTPNRSYQIPVLDDAELEMRWKYSPSGLCTEFMMVGNPERVYSEFETRYIVEYLRDSRDRIARIVGRTEAHAAIGRVGESQPIFELLVRQWDLDGRWSEAELRAGTENILIERSWWKREDVTLTQPVESSGLTRKNASTDCFGMDVFDVLDPNLRSPFQSVELGVEELQERFGEIQVVKSDRGTANMNSDGTLPVQSRARANTLAQGIWGEAFQCWTQRRKDDRIEFVHSASKSGLAILLEQQEGTPTTIGVFDLDGRWIGRIRRWREVGVEDPEIRIEFPEEAARLVLRTSFASELLFGDVPPTPVHEVRVRWDRMSRISELLLIEQYSSVLELRNERRISYEYRDERSLEEIRFERGAPEWILVGRIVPNEWNASGWWTSADVQRGLFVRTEIDPSEPPAARFLRRESRKGSESSVSTSGAREIDRATEVSPRRPTNRAPRGSIATQSSTETDRSSDGADMQSDSILAVRRSEVSAFTVILAFIVVTLGLIRVVHRDLRVGRNWPWQTVLLGALALGCLSVSFMHDAGERAALVTQTSRFASYISALPSLLIGTLACAVVPAFLGIRNRQVELVAVFAPLIGLYTMLAGLTGSADPATLVEVLTRQLSPEAEQVRQFLEAEGLLNDEAAEMLWRMRAKPESATGLYFFLMVAVGLVIVAFPAARSNDREAAEESMEDL